MTGLLKGCFFDRSAAGRGFCSSFLTYGAFVKNAFLRMLAYRLRYYTGIFTYLLFVSVHYFIWQAVFSGRPEGERINGFTLSEMITYVAVGWIARSFYFSNIDDEIDDMVRTGQISIYLLRPVNFQLAITAYALGQSFFRLVCFSLPIGVVVVLLFPVELPPRAADFFYFAVSTFFGALILIEINFLVGLVAFSLKSTQGLMRAKYYLVQLLSGLLLPLSFFPDAMQKLLHYLPFETIAYVPLRFYLGKVGPSEVAWVFGNQFAWIMVLAFSGSFFWHRALARLSLQGG